MWGPTEIKAKKHYSNALAYNVIMYCDVKLEYFKAFLLSPADNLCKQFGLRSGPKPIDTLIVFLTPLFEKKDLKKKVSRQQQIKLPNMQS